MISIKSNGKENLITNSNTNSVVMYNYAFTKEEIGDMFFISNGNSYIELSEEEGKSLNDLIINHPEIKWWWLFKESIIFKMQKEWEKQLLS